MVIILVAPHNKNILKYMRVGQFASYCTALFQHLSLQQFSVDLDMNPPLHKLPLNRKEGKFFTALHSRQP